MRYTVVMLTEPEIDGYVVHVPTVGITTQGYSNEHALEMAAEAAQLRLEVMVEDGEELPTEPLGAIIAAIDVSLPEPSFIGTVGSRSVTEGSDRAMP